MVRNKVKNSSIKFEGVNCKLALIYLRLAMSPTEKIDAEIQGLMYRRINTQCRKPTVKKMKDPDQINKWWFPKPTKFLTQEDKQLIVGCIAQQLVKVLFDTANYI